jgi:hydroxymethylpyrimidine/phosphomethylpyrimidine kinase
MQAVFEDIGADAVKTGMLSSAGITALVSAKLRQYKVERLVVDPVMVSTGGDQLIKRDAVDVLKRELLPISAVTTPNLGEAEVLAEMTITNRDDMREAARRIHGLGARSVVIKGGHYADPRNSVDLFYDGERYLEFRSPRIPTGNTHGSGCTFASAIAAFLAKGVPLVESIEQAKGFVSQAIRHSFDLGHGHGPLGHFFASWSLLKGE